jgi:hemoglobin
MNEQPTGERLRRTGRLVPEGLDEAMVRAVVDSFYAKARRDPVIGPVFNAAIADEEWPAHLDLITDFWSSMLLGSGRYGGRPMQAHLKLPGLEDRHFARWLQLFGETVRELCPPRVAALFVDRAERIGHNFRLGLAMRRGVEDPQLEFIRA